MKNERIDHYVYVLDRDDGERLSRLATEISAVLFDILCARRLTVASETTGPSTVLPFARSSGQLETTDLDRIF